MSQQEHWHPGTRSSYITALALVRSHAEHHGRFPPHPRHDDARSTPKRLPPSAIPDLRFEPTYLAKLATAGPGWQSVLWVTVRDQVIGPLIQGALWGAASVFIQPLVQSLFGWWPSRRNSLPQKEGSAVAWLRQWAFSLLPDGRWPNSARTR
ncbi:hypothetical protein BC827DRAFT_1233770 [Russula dissimulans]|nr:hypothetical protein BC827DRAFT_1233770 [Russula dissimulans]